jgi:Cu-Zn family superoxide dismutase
MNLTTVGQHAALVATAALIVGCSPDTSERGAGAPESRPADGQLDRNEPSVQPPSQANRDAGGGAARNPATTPVPATPGGAAPSAATAELVARAEMRPLGDGTARGTIEFRGHAAGPLTIHLMLMGLDAGPHGFHVHSGSDCAAPGDHLNPQNTPHGPATAGADARHRGDLGNVTADASGMVEEMLRDSVLGGDSSFIGKVIVVHGKQDDLTTQPDGGSGDLVACGVIQSAGQDLLSRGEDPSRGV